MAVRRIYTFADAVLRRKAQPVERVDKDTRRLVDDMIATMREADGIGLAAPQVGVSRRVFVAEVDETVYVLINPAVLDASPDSEVADEGCLSLPGYAGAVARRVRVRVRGQDRRGKTVTVEAEGLLARCFQHELDHLDGILYIDRMAPAARLRPVRDGESDENAERLEA